MNAETEKVLDLMRRHGIGIFDYDDGEVRLSLRLAESLGEIQVLSPAPGRFSTDHPSSPKSAVSPRSVRKGDIVGWLSVGPLLIAVRTDKEGLLGRPLVDDESIVGYGTRLF